MMDIRMVDSFDCLFLLVVVGRSVGRQVGLIQDTIILFHRANITEQGNTDLPCVISLPRFASPFNNVNVYGRSPPDQQQQQQREEEEPFINWNGAIDTSI